jgi:hypothetical protein
MKVRIISLSSTPFLRNLPNIALVNDTREVIRPLLVLGQDLLLVAIGPVHATFEIGQATFAANKTFTVKGIKSPLGFVKGFSVTRTLKKTTVPVKLIGKARTNLLIYASDFFFEGERFHRREND